MSIISDIQAHAHPDKARIYARYFKTGKGEYAEGDVFLGLTVPEQRTIAKKYVSLPLAEIEELLYSKFHEHRLTGLIILVYKYEKASLVEKKNIIKFYLEHKQRSNNWDLIDCIADKLLGKHLLQRDKSILYELAKSDSVWDRRIAIITTFEFIKHNDFEHTLQLAAILLNDKHDLIQKAVGWMLREIGKRDEKALLKFLDKHSKEMPRTMLRYAIERLNENIRKSYMQR